MRPVLITLAITLLAAPVMADVYREAGLDRRSNNILALLGIDDPAKAKAVRQSVSEYYDAATKSDDALLAKLSEQASADKVQQEKQYISMLLAMPLTGAEPSISVEEAAYSKAIVGRAEKIVQTLDISDAAKSQMVQILITNQYRALRDNDAIRDAKLKVSGNSGPAADAVKEQTLAARKILHDAYLASLSQHLTAEQIEKVKDGHTSGKVEFTFRGYQLEYPNMTDEQKAKVVELLKEARELAMDGGSSNEKDAIFNKYKGKINNWLSSQGVKSKKQLQKETQATTQP